MNRKIAAIDLGTNTFHLLIAEAQRDSQSKLLFDVVERNRVFIMLAESGIGHIAPPAYKRAMNALLAYADAIKKHQISEVYAFATEGMRKADNAERFITEVRDKTGIEIRCISGKMEAELIYHGVKNTIDFEDGQNMLIMDIGGGSTEFVIANETEMLWRESFPLGGSVLKNRFHHQEPMAAYEMRELQLYLNHSLRALQSVAEQFPVHMLMGTSGTFDTLADMVFAMHGLERDPNSLADKMNVSDFSEITSKLVAGNLEDRKRLPGMHPQRASMAAVTCLLVENVCRVLDIGTISNSNYAIKEGILWCALYKPKTLEEI